MTDAKTERNARVQARYDELMREGKHGHYESMFRVVREEVENERNRPVSDRMVDRALKAWFATPPSETDQGLERSMRAAVEAAHRVWP